MNPEAGLIQGAYREAVIRISRQHPTMPAKDVLLLARGIDVPIPPPAAQTPADPVRSEASTPEHQLDLSLT